jgi:RNA polymerase sigma-70 factor (ECF subfamily)
MGKTATILRPLWRRAPEKGGSVLPSLSDEVLAGMLADGNREAFAELVRRHNSRFYAYAYRTLHNHAEAEDIVQTCFLKLWQKPGAWQPGRGARFTTWFYRIVYHACCDALRKTTPLELVADMAEKTPHTAPSGEEALHRKTQHQAIATHMKNLPERQAQALILCFYQGLTNKEAASVLNVGVKALESLLMRAKANLKHHLDEGNMS